MLTDFGTHPADRVPKAELHAHLEGTIPPPVLRMLADRNGIALPDGVLAPELYILSPSWPCLEIPMGRREWWESASCCH